MTEKGGRDSNVSSESEPAPSGQHESGKDLEEIQRLFRKLDRNKSGKLEASDLQSALQEAGLPNQSKEYIGLLMQQYGCSKEQEIDFEAFKAYIEHKASEIAAAFKEIDEDKSGSISPLDLEKTLKRQWLPVDYGNAGRMVHLLDTDGDEAVSLEEFRAFAALLPEVQVNESGILDGWRDSSEWTEGIEYNFAAVPPKPSFNRIVASGVAGGLSKSFVAPMERLRILMMTDRNNISVRKTALKMWKDGGLFGLFRGNMATVLKIVPQTATQFVVYDSMQSRMMSGLDPDPGNASHRLNTMQHAVAGGLAGAAASLVSYPLETIRTHMSVCSKLPMSTILREIWSTSGLTGLYRGIQASMSNSVLTNALGFAAYEAATDAYRNQTGTTDPGPGVKGLCAGVSACATMAVVMPLENVERRLQVQGRDNFPVVYHGTWDCAKRMYQAEGVHVFWRGSVASFAKVAPSLAVVRAVYEMSMSFNVQRGTRQYRGITNPQEPVK